MELEVVTFRSKDLGERLNRQNNISHPRFRLFRGLFLFMGELSGILRSLTVSIGVA